MSLRIRLTLWFTAVLVVALGLLGFLVFTLVSQELSAEVDASVQNKAHDLALGVRFVNQQVFVPNRIQVPDSEFRAPAIYSVIRDPQGQIVYRSDNLLGSDLPASEVALVSARNGVPAFETVVQAGQAIRLYTAPILTTGRLIGFVQVGRNLADIDVALSHLRSRLLASAGLVLFVAAAGGLLLAHLALRPMD